MNDYLRIDLGCGKNKYGGYKGADKSRHVNPDFLYDIGRDRWPHDDRSVNTFHSAHTFEHLSGEEIMHAMNEAWRTLVWAEDYPNDKYSGQIWIHVPHKDCDLADQDPTHKTKFVKTSMQFFCGEFLSNYKLAYPIDCIFALICDDDYVPDNLGPGKDGKYCTMLRFGLLKSRKHASKWRDKFPFNIPIEERYFRNGAGKKTISKEGIREFNPEWYMNTRWNVSHDVKFSNKLLRIAKRAVNEKMKEIMEIKLDATKRYGDKPDPLGTKGLFADINRKHKRLKRFFWDEIRDVGEENIKDTIYDLEIYTVLLSMSYDRELREELEKKYG